MGVHTNIRIVKCVMKTSIYKQANPFQMKGKTFKNRFYQYILTEKFVVEMHSMTEFATYASLVVVVAFPCVIVPFGVSQKTWAISTSSLVSRCNMHAVP